MDRKRNRLYSAEEQDSASFPVKPVWRAWVKRTRFLRRTAGAVQNSTRPELQESASLVGSSRIPNRDADTHPQVQGGPTLLKTKTDSVLHRHGILSPGSSDLRFARSHRLAGFEDALL